MKKILCALLALLLLAATGLGLAERTAQQIEGAEAIADLLASNYGSVEDFIAQSWYDRGMDAIVLTVGMAGYTGDDFAQMRAAGPMDEFYTIFIENDPHEIILMALDLYEVGDMDFYFMVTSEDGVIQYLAVNGNNLTDFIYPN